MASDLEQRAAYVKGLRDLADFLETHTDVPVTESGAIGPWWSHRPDTTPERALALAEALDGTVRVEDRNYVRIERAFGPITYQITLSARYVCVEREELTKVYDLPEALKARERSS